MGRVPKAARTPNAKRFGRAFRIVTPGITIKERLQGLQPNAEGNNDDTRRDLAPRDLSTDLNRARIVITNDHACKRRETLEAATGTRRALEGHRAPLQMLETEGQMIRRAMGDLLALGPVTAINDEAHHCHRERPKTEARKGEERREAGVSISIETGPRLGAHVWMPPSMQGLFRRLIPTAPENDRSPSVSRIMDGG